MVIASLAEVIAVYRARAALEPSHVAEQAGISVAQYLALEHGTAWPGTEAVEAIIKTLQIPHSHRAPLTAIGAPLDIYLQRMLHRYDIPALIVDSAWRTVEANTFARALLPGSAWPGWNLMRWILLDADARRRLANWDDVAQSFSGALHSAITAAPQNSELLAIHNDAPNLGYSPHPAAGDCPDGQVLVWRTDSGAYQISACMVTIPNRRPDLQQIILVPRGHRPSPAVMAAPSSPALWSEPLLTGLLSCGLCGLLLTGGSQPTIYNCPTGCLPELPADQLELHIAQHVLLRAFSTEACRGLGIAQEVLLADGGDLKLNVPISAQHALNQWQCSMTDTQRRGILTATLRSATVHPSVHHDGVDLAYNWLERN
ncbi:XRE family transcriptional regulator [Streptomyces sp. 372A]